MKGQGNTKSLQQKYHTGLEHFNNCDLVIDSGVEGFRIHRNGKNERRHSRRLNQTVSAQFQESITEQHTGKLTGPCSTNCRL